MSGRLLREAPRKEAHTRYMDQGEQERFIRHMGCVSGVSTKTVVPVVWNGYRALGVDAVSPDEAVQIASAFGLEYVEDFGSLAILVHCERVMSYARG